MHLFLVVIAFLLLAIGFARYLVKRDQGEREPIKALWLAFGFGIVSVVIAGVFELLFVPDVLHGDYTLGAIAVISLSIGVIEELSKCLLPIWYFYRKRYFNEHTDGVIYFALAGLGFGLPENILYTFQYGAEAGLTRIVMTPLFHAATTGMIGYALAKAKLSETPKSRVATMIMLVIVLHALYDFGLFSQQPIFVLMSVMLTLALTAGLFLLFLHARTLDQLKGLSVVGHNSFCRSCGHPNPKHNLYCSSCGKRA